MIEIYTVGRSTKIDITPQAGSPESTSSDTRKPHMGGHLRAAIKSRWSISVQPKLLVSKENIRSEAKWHNCGEKAMDWFSASDFVQLQISAPDLDFGLARQSNTKTMYLSVLAWKLHSHIPCIARPGLPGLKTKLNWYALTLNLALTWMLCYDILCRAYTPYGQQVSLLPPAHS